METEEVRDTAHRARDNDALRGAARAGYVVVGVLHVLLAWLALQVAFGSSGKQADPSGALETLAGNGLGRALLWLAVVAFVGLTLFEVAEAVLGRPTSGEDEGEWANRAKDLGKAVVYAVLGWSALTFAVGGSKDSRQQTVDITATLMRQPGGRLLVGAVGVGVLAVGAYHVYKGWTQKFLEDLEESPGRWATVAGRVGYVAKGVALAVVGVLFVVAAVHRRAGEATGLDGALRTLRDQPFGTVLLVVVAAGLAAYGLYSVSRARHMKV
jgi:hypothetical protein